MFTSVLTFFGGFFVGFFFLAMFSSNQYEKGYQDGKLKKWGESDGE